jgi:hypothetical protein
MSILDHSLTFIYQKKVGFTGKFAQKMVIFNQKDFWACIIIGKTFNLFDLPVEVVRLHL